MQQSPNEESLEQDIAIYDENTIIDIIGQVQNCDELLEHYLATDNAYADGEFDDNNVIV